MRLLPDGLLQTLAALDPSNPFALFLRHAERAPLDSTDPYADVDLTERGEQQASALANVLPTRLQWAATSPFLRCARTAHFLCDGAAEVDVRLGRPGPWVIDDAAGARLFAELGTEGVVRAQLRGVRWPFIRGAVEGTHLLLSAAQERLEAERGPGLCISHDAVLMPALDYLAGSDFDGSWLEPLDGFAVQVVHGSLRCTWHGRQNEVPKW